MQLDFPQPTNDIVLRSGDDAWGPYQFEFKDAMPPSTTITSATATAYLYSRGSYTETPDLIEPDSIVVDSDTTVQLKLQSDDLSEGTYYLKIEITLNNSGVKNFLFGPIYLRKLE